ncbi:hypothetical protein DTO280E4_9005 [Paecilomyces variotii]|nr:hypothetical protein DTO217A2_3253 [Paecilomyces variotii]KAJ9349463.1 hypothetical protein DTO280E4_9005 [Paecilomyces variotii]
MMGPVDRTTEIVQDVLSFFAENSKHTLADSRHAPKNARQMLSAKRPSRFPEELRLGAEKGTHPETRLHDLHTNTNTVAAPPFRRSPLSSGKQNNLRTTTSATAKTTMAPPADIDDTAAFMAAVRSRRQQALSSQSDSIASSTAEVDHVETLVEAPIIPEPSPSKQKKENVEHAKAIAPEAPVMPLKEEKQSASFSPSVGLEASKWANPRFVSPTRAQRTLRDREASISVVTPQARTPEAVTLTKEPEIVETPEVPKPSITEEEDREHLTHFKTWGAPMARDKPAAQVRLIILSNLPSTYNAPAKVLTLIHGGAIESVRLSAGGCAYILFCDATACKAYYDQYPNGIPVGPGGRQTIFVDIGKEVDVVSSQLTIALSTGATRVIRCAGVDMNVSMSTLYEMASANNRKVEKIIDSYVSGESRLVIFRFCSIEDAIRFKSALVRDDDWEHCNVQYGEDPCELATGLHFD